jgi:hypothetical protein
MCPNNCIFVLAAPIEQSTPQKKCVLRKVD